MKNGNLSLFSKSLWTDILSSTSISRSKNVACVTQCSSFSSNSPGYIHLKGFENSSSSFIVQRLSMNRLVAWYLQALLQNKILNKIKLKKIKKQICPEKNRVIRAITNVIVSIRLFPVSYPLSRPVKVQYMEVAEIPILQRTVDLKTKLYYFCKNFNKVCGMQSAKIVGGNFFSSFSSFNDT